MVSDRCSILVRSLSKIMLKLLLLPLALCCLAITIRAQSPLPNGIVGVPYSTDLADGLASPPAVPGFQVSYNYSLASGMLPPGLTLSASGLINGIPTGAGTFAFLINFNFNSTFLNLFLPLNLIMEVSGSTGSPVVAIPGGLIFALTQSSPTAVQAISVINRGAQSSGFTASTGAASPWLTVDPGSGAVNAFTSAAVMVKADTTGLPSGTYTGVVSVTAALSGERFDTRVIATNASSQPFILLSQTGLRFQTVQGGGLPLVQSITVVDPGPSPVSYSVSTSTLSGGKWLSASPPTGTSTFSSTSLIQVSVDPTGLTPGDYYGQVLLTPLGASGLVGVSTSAVVLLNVFAPGKSPGALVQPAGLLFVGRASPGSPASKTLLVANPSPVPLNFSAVQFLDAPGNWLGVSPAASAVMTAAAPVPVTVQPNLTGLAPGTYHGEIDLRFAEDGSVRRIAVLLVVLPASASSPSDSAAPGPVAGCTPNKLVGVPTVLPSGFRATSGFPASIEVSIADNCGTPVTAGTVTASFSSGDPQLSLLSLKDGRWSATWQPRASAAQVTISVRARQTLPALEGSFDIGGVVQANTTTAMILPGGVVSAASYAAQQPLAPGSYIAIFGAHLSPGLNQSPSLPLSLQLGGTQAMLGDKTLPLQFTSDGQINAIVPFDVPANTSQNLIIQNGPTLSNSEPVAIAPAQPAVFTKDLSGKGAGIVTGFKPDGTAINSGQVLDAANPASAGDTIVIYCAGLGAVDPAVPAGQAAPLSPLSRTVNPVRVTIGGKDASVGFSGLAPTFAGLYQINAIVPAGVAAGDAELVVSVAGLQSAPVTIPVR